MGHDRCAPRVEHGLATHALSLRGNGAFWDIPPSVTRFRYRAGDCIGAMECVAERAASIDEVAQ
jgi:hypothetical protein